DQTTGRGPPSTCRKSEQRSTLAETRGSREFQSDFEAGLHPEAWLRRAQASRRSRAAAVVVAPSPTILPPHPGPAAAARSPRVLLAAPPPFAGSLQIDRPTQTRCFARPVDEALSCAVFALRPGAATRALWLRPSVPRRTD